MVNPTRGALTGVQFIKITMKLLLRKESRTELVRHNARPAAAAVCQKLRRGRMTRGLTGWISPGRARAAGTEGDARVLCRAPDHTRAYLLLLAARVFGSRFTRSKKYAHRHVM